MTWEYVFSVSMFAGALSDNANAIGKGIAKTAITIYRFAEGKVMEGWTEYDSLEMMQQLGVVPQPGG